MLINSSFHHIGFAVEDIQTTAKYYTEIGFQLSETVLDEVQNVKVAFLNKAGSPLIELVEGLDQTSPVKKILEKNGVSPYHICYEVEDINMAAKELKVKKFLPLFKPVGATAFDGRLICYFYNKDVGLVELLNK